jgi:hypothetical protein
LWSENFGHVKSLKLLDSLHIKYPNAIAFGYMLKADGPRWIRSNPIVKWALSSPFPEVSSGRENETWNCKLHLQPKA